MSANPTFPDLSRRPALKTKGMIVDPTLRDNLENGMESTRAKFTRRRREWTLTIEYLSWDDVALLDQFVQTTVQYGALAFIFPDLRNPQNPQQYVVRFSKLPEYTDSGWVEDGYRQNLTFELREV